MEFGPRALGSRSILFHTKDKSVNDWLNVRLKRTEFMPFAPVTTEKLASECFEGWNKLDLCAPFMTKTFKCKKQLRNDAASKNTLFGCILAAFCCFGRSFWRPGRPGEKTKWPKN